MDQADSIHRPEFIRSKGPGVALSTYCVYIVIAINRSYQWPVLLNPRPLLSTDTLLPLISGFVVLSMPISRESIMDLDYTYLFIYL